MLKKLQSLFAGETKSFRAQPMVAMHSVGRPQWTPRNYASLASAGFAGNAIGYRAVRMIAEAASSVPLLLYQGDKEILQNPMKALLQRNCARRWRQTFSQRANVRCSNVESQADAIGDKAALHVGSTHRPAAYTQ